MRRHCILAFNDRNVRAVLDLLKSPYLIARLPRPHFRRLCG